MPPPPAPEPEEERVPLLGFEGAIGAHLSILDRCCVEG